MIAQQLMRHKFRQTIKHSNISLLGCLLLMGCSSSTVTSSNNPARSQQTPPHDAINQLIDRQKREPQASHYPNLSQQSNYNKAVYIHPVDRQNWPYQHWLEQNPHHQQTLNAYQQFLAHHITNVPPMSQLVVSARDAVSCGYEPYEIPPRALWNNIVPTLQLLTRLKQQGYLPPSTVIRSVYRNPALNRCAGGASASKHMTNGAIDIWIPEYEGNRKAINNIFNNLCYFWRSQGRNYNFGLGLYSTGAIHLDTQGYRTWGGNYSASSSSCQAL